MTTALLNRKTSRLDLRMTDSQKRQIEEAASICGISVSQWSINRLLASARADIESERRMELSAASFDEFARLLDDAVDPCFASFAAQRSRWEQ